MQLEKKNLLKEITDFYQVSSLGTPFIDLKLNIRFIIEKGDTIVQIVPFNASASWEFSAKSGVTPALKNARKLYSMPFNCCIAEEKIKK